jgi:predicted Zn-dependent protease
VFESAVADYPQIMAHELGHYLGLEHVSNTSNAMNAIIYPYSEDLSDSQCDQAREIAQEFWSGMMR